MTDINLITGVANAYTFQPYKLKETAQMVGQIQFLYTIKAIVTAQGDDLFYKLYRCGWDGTPNSDPSYSEHGVPQGLSLYGTANEIQEIARILFPVLVTGGAIPDIFEYGELEKENDDS